MIYSAKIVYLVNQIVLGKVAYLEIINAKPEYKEEIDAYIEEKDLSIEISE